MSGSPHGSARRPGGALFVALSASIAGVVGVALGGVAGGVLYEALGPPWAQLGYEFEGTAGGLGTFPTTAPRWVGPVVIAGVVGAVVGAIAGAWLAGKGTGSPAREGASEPPSR